MVMDRYNLPVVKIFFDGVFSLQETYHTTIARIQELCKKNVPAGVVEDEDSLSQNKDRIAQLRSDLETRLTSLERSLPGELAKQQHIAELLSKVRAYVS